MSVPFSTLLASTIKHYKKGFVDNIIKDFILLAALGDKDIAANVFKMRTPEPSSDAYAEGIKLVDNPGEKIFMPVMYDTNNTVAAYAGYENIDISPQEPFTAVEYDWKSIAGAINVDNDRLDKNAGDDVRLFDLMKGYMDNLKISMQAKVNDFLIYKKTASTGNEAKKPLGLLDIIPDDNTADPTIGAIGGISVNGGLNTWWRPQMLNQASAAFGTDSASAGQKNLRQLIRNCTFGAASRPNLIIAGDVAYGLLENSLVNQIRYNLSPVEGQKANLLAQAGFESFIFSGIPVVREKVVDEARSAASLTGSAFYVLNTKNLKVWGMKRRWFEPSSVREPADQDTQVALLISRLNLTTDNRRTLGVMRDVVNT